MRTLSIRAGVVIAGVLIAGVLAWSDVAARAADAPARARHTNTLYIAAPTPLPTDNTKLAVPTLVMRELPRQALLMAARDELGLYTRDGVLREPPPERDARDASLRFEMGFRSGPTLPVTVSDGGPEGGKLLSHEIRLTMNTDYPDMLKLIEEAETLSRGQYLELLKGAGFSAVAGRAAKTEKQDLSQVEGRLDELTEVSQFAAIRGAHASIAKSGSSAEAMGILVRGYANLAQLTRAAWSPSTDVFAARSLLYAQRMVVLDPTNPLFHWYRAYALAMFGLHRDAIIELEGTRKLAAQAKPPVVAPAWAQLLEPLCRYQTNKLLDVAAKKDASAPLAMYMCFLTVENCGSEAATIEFGKQAVELNPKCVRLIDAICDKSGVAYQHVLTEMGPAIHASALPGELHAIDPLPANVAAAVKSLEQQGMRPVTVAAVGKELVKASDDAEPSWAALGRTLQEIDFTHVRRRADFMAMWWGVDASGFVQEAMPLVAEHPYLPLIKAYGIHANRPEAAVVKQTLKDLNFVDPRPNIGRAVPITQPGADEKRLVGNLAWRRAQENMDLTAYDIEMMLPIEHPDQMRRSAQRMLHEAWHARVASPFCAVAKAAYIILDWNHAKDDVELWSKEHPNHPALTGTLARKYSDLQDYEKAEKYWTAYLKVAPEASASRQLADDYLKDGKEDMWLKTLEESLKHEDYGLEHSITNIKIARHYMDAKAFDKARPYAEAAAQSGSEGSMVCAAECYEGLKQWDLAAQMVKEEADRYQRPIRWLFWCKRTGHGDMAGAVAASRDYVSGIRNRVDTGALNSKIEVFLLTNEPTSAVAPLQKEFDVSGNPWAAAHLGLIYLAQGNKEAARDIFQKGAVRGLEFKFPNSQGGLPAMAAVCQFMAASLDPKQPNKFRVDDIKGTAANLPVVQKTDIWYVVGRFLELQGRKDEAVEAYKLAAYTDQANRLDALLAIGELRAMGELPAAY